MSIHLNQFKDLLLAVEKFGVIDFSKATEIRKEIEQLEEGEGLDTDLSDIFFTDEGQIFTILQDGSIRKGVIHIVDISSWRLDYAKFPKFPRFHIYGCEKIEEMKRKHRGHRYKVSSRKDGKFYLMRNKKKWYEPLLICSYCLLLYNEEFEEEKTKSDFPLKEYLKEPMTHSKLPEVELDFCTVPNCYESSWRKMSRYKKEKDNYICSNCRKNFSKKKHRKFLHTHHVNANKRDNTKENLKVLCIECHAKEYQHGHIRQSKSYQEYLRIKNEISFPEMES